MMPATCSLDCVLKSKLDKVLRIERYFGVQRHDSSSIGATGVRVWKTASSKVVP
jgi:hypothetical protein